MDAVVSRKQAEARKMQAEVNNKIMSTTWNTVLNTKFRFDFQKLATQNAAAQLAGILSTNIQNL